MKKYKLLAIDIDGTLLNSRGKISDENIDAIRRAIENGIKVCLCTGRNIKNTRAIAKKINSDFPFVCADGTVFYDTKNNKVIKEYLIEKSTFEKIIEEANKHNLYMEFCTKRHYIKYVRNIGLEKYGYGDAPKTIMEKLEHHFIKNVRYVKNHQKFKNKFGGGINQFIISGEQRELEKMKKFLIESDFSDVDIRVDLWSDFIFIVPKDCNKAYGLNILSDYFDIDISEMIAIGDQMNDIDMIKKAGLGVAMGNATDEIKKVAGFITSSNDDSGVAFAIKKFVLEEY